MFSFILMLGIEPWTQHIFYHWAASPLPSLFAVLQTESRGFILSHIPAVFFFFNLRKDIAKLFRLASNLWSSCLNLLEYWDYRICYHALPIYQFLKWDCLPLTRNSYSVYVFWMQVICQIYIDLYFLPAWDLPFYFLTGVFWRVEILNFDEADL